MKTCVLILALVAIVNAAYNYEYQDEDYEDKYPKENLKSSSHGEVEEKKPIYDLKDAPKLFDKFIKDNNKQYKDQTDYEKHYENFVETLKEINRVNSSGATYTSDINLFADKGEDEFSVLAGLGEEGFE